VTLSDYLARAAASTDQWLDRLLPAESVEPVDLHRAMRYSVFAGGKRLRPLLCAATGESFGAREQAVMPIA
jgi:geranylgeranyl diphosphate synthase type II